MEPRGCLAQYDRDEDRYTIRCTMQSVHDPRALAGQIFKVPQNKIRVVCDNMGGGFGMKGGAYPEYALSLWASEVIGRPVRWIAERSEGLQSDEQARGSIVETELALDRDGQIPRAARAGRRRSAPTTRPTATSPLTIGLGCLVNTYTIPAVHAEVIGVLTNTMTIAPLSRRQPARADLCDRDDHRQGGARAGHRPGRIAPPQHDPAERDAVHDARCSQTYDSGDFVKNLEDCARKAGL